MSEKGKRTREDKKHQDKEKMVELGVAEVGEDATKYGEFISSYFAWISLPDQKEIAQRLAHITDDNPKEREQFKNIHTNLK
ncbi:MAG: hypothetical protein ACLU8F_01640 [Clostridia bacterium]